MPKKGNAYKSVITDMINKEYGHKKELLVQLKRLNKKAYVEMLKFFADFKTKYRMLQKTDLWKEGRELLLEYFTYDNILICPQCGFLMDFRSATLHHHEYKVTELFTPDFVEFVHPKCHAHIHHKKHTYKRKDK